MKPDELDVWLSIAEVVALTGENKSTVTRKIAAGGYQGRRVGGDGRAPWQVRLASLSEATQQAYASNLARELRDEARSVLAAVEAPDAAADQTLSEEDYRLIWERYERQSETIKSRARHALDVVCAFVKLQSQGMPVKLIDAALQSQYGTSSATVWRYRKAVEGHPRPHWEALLSPQYVGGGKEAPFSDEAYAWILARFLSTSEPNAKSIIRDARKLAEQQGWSIPTNKTVLRRLSKEPAWLTIAGRQGGKALERSYPTVDRDYSALRVHQRWQSDGRRADVFCRWPDGSTGRPFIVVWMDERSRVVLSVKGYRDPCLELTLSSFRLAVQLSGRVPESAKLDNGREYSAKAVTGGQSRRYRFKVIPDEQTGALTRMGTLVDWSPPGKGRDKLIESFWNVIAEQCDKSPDFEGAYCGKDPVSKPDNFDATRHAVPLEDYARKLADACDAYNRTEGHRGHGMEYRSPLQVYGDLLHESRAKAPDPAHLRQLLMGATVLKLDRNDASLRLKIEGYGVCRFDSPALRDLPLTTRYNSRFQVYFDPENPNTPVAVYDRKDQFICEAEPLARIPVIETGDRPASTAHAKARGAYVKKAKGAVKAIRNAAPALLPSLSDACLPPLPLSDGRSHPVDIEAPKAKPEPSVPSSISIPDKCVDRITGATYHRKVVSIAEGAQEEPKLPPRRNLMPGWLDDAKSA